MLKRFRSARSAFTLIELLVVVAIIALLISILLPSLGRAREQAKIVKCGAQLKDIGNSLAAYQNDYNRLPHQNTIGSHPGPGLAGELRKQRDAAGMWGYAVHEAIANYMGGLRQDIDTGQLSKTHAVFYCPVLRESDVHNLKVVSGPGTGNGIDTTEDKYIHISYNYYGRLDETRNDPNEGANFTSVAGINDSALTAHIQIKRKHYAGALPRGDDVLMADAAGWWVGGDRWRINHGTGWSTPFIANPRPMITGANLMYGDGHVEWKKDNYFREANRPQSPGNARVEITTNATMKRPPVTPSADQGFWW